ncbi:MAG: hypothetical protein HC850_00725 [Rhodomicrobium sp.]|nr:hypothetical protein [Rhodomicrobium sp.]
MMLVNDAAVVLDPQAPIFVVAFIVEPVLIDTDYCGLSRFELSERFRTAASMLKDHPVSHVHAPHCAFILPWL